MEGEEVGEVLGLVLGKERKGRGSWVTQAGDASICR